MSNGKTRMLVKRERVFKSFAGAVGLAPKGTTVVLANETSAVLAKSDEVGGREPQAGRRAVESQNLN